MDSVPVLIDLLKAITQTGASDVFLTEGRPPYARIDGVVRKFKREEITKEELDLFFQHVLNVRQLSQFEEDGDLDAGFSLDDGLRFRLNISKQQGRIGIVARALPSGKLEFDQLGLPPILEAYSQNRSGIVLVTGATGSGKSTTLAAMVNYINQNRRLHVVTIEDPIEFLHTDARSRISQREVGQDTVSFHEALKRVVRQSPDVILIGEMRDKESISVAMAAALTGHLVLATVHTIDTTQTLQRIMAYFPENMRSQVAVDLSLSLRGIVSQRLIPNKDGNGRSVACEVLSNTPAVSQLLREMRYSELEDLVRNSRTDDLFSFNQSLRRMENQGLIDHETALAYSSNPDEYALMAQGMSAGGVMEVKPQTEEGAVPDIKRLLQMALSKGASDLHLCVGRPPIFRIDGQLEMSSSRKLLAQDMRMLLNSIMNGRQRTLFELEKEVDFSLSMADGVRFRINAYYQRGHMAAALRAIPSETPNPERLGIGENILRFAQKPHGLILVVGPTGSGKSTTLACLIDRINQNRRCRIITIEDPIEFTHTEMLATIDQRELHADTKSFSSALKYILRQDPDVILVGEMRDQETIGAALTAAETGHLVFATLHTNDAVQTIDRIIDVFPAYQQDQVRAQLASSLVAVISQRLLTAKNGHGRIPAFEIMVGTNAIRHMIRDNKMHQALGTMEASKSEGMITMDRTLRDLMQADRISEEEALRHAKNPNMVLQGAASSNLVGGRRYR